MDNHTKEQRHANMVHIKSTSKPEEIVRNYLFKRGFRYRKNDKRYPGKPDIVLPKYKTVIFVNGCFWHHHPGCSRAAIPKSNEDYWIPKLKRNIERDQKDYMALRNAGWRVIVVWECSLKKTSRMDTLEKLADEITSNK